MYKIISLSKKKEYIIKDTTKDFIFDLGVLKKEDINSNENLIKINGISYLKIIQNDYDKTNYLKRSAQIITKKDIGYILIRSSINSSSNILEAGSGSASLTIWFSRFCKFVKTFEIEKNHFDICKKNIEDFKCDNVEILNEDLYNFLKTNNSKKDLFDLIFLDMLDCEKVFDYNLDILKKGQYICMYIPNITKIVEVFKKIKNREKEFFIEEISEITLREWKIGEKVTHPKNKKEIDFTSFLVFIKKLF